VTIDYDDVLVFSINDVAGVDSALFRIYEFPDGFAEPSGWSTSSEDGAYYYLSKNGAPPPAVAAPPSPLWGDFLCDVKVNQGKRQGVNVSDLYDNSLGLTLPSPNGVPDFPYQEDKQFNAQRSWVSKLKELARTVSAHMVNNDLSAPAADAQSFLGNPTGVEAEVTSLAAAVNQILGRLASGNIGAFNPNDYVFTNLDSGGGNPSTKVGPHEARAFASLSTAANRNEDFTLSADGYYRFRVTLLVRLASAGAYRTITQTVDGVRASGTLTILGTAQQVATGVPTGLTMTLSATSGNLRANVANAAGASVVCYIEFGDEIRDGIST
jgi:hypothetical protein